MTDKSQKKERLLLPFLAFSLLFSLIILLFCGIMETYLAKRSNVANVTADSTVTVILDPGHGGEDGGAVGNGNVYEKDLNLAIAKQMEMYLKMNGVSVVCTRNEDILLYDKNTDYEGRKKVLDLAARLKISRETENSVFVSIHMNSFPQSGTRGLQVYYSKNHDDSASLASLLQERTRSYLSPQNRRKIKAASSNIYLLDRITTPAVLIECGFLSNDEECALLANEEYQKKLSLVLADSITRFLKNDS